MISFIGWGALELSCSVLHVAHVLHWLHTFKLLCFVRAHGFFYVHFYVPHPPLSFSLDLVPIIN